MKKIYFRKTICLTGMLLLLPTLVLAVGGERRGGERKGPSESAITACAGRTVGAVVEFSGRRNDTIQGTCQERDGLLFAVPEGHRRGRGRR